MNIIMSRIWKTFPHVIPLNFQKTHPRIIYQELNSSTSSE
jgi:hypothetical protein